jgi:aminomethyltransferase
MLRGRFHVGAAPDPFTKQSAMSNLRTPLYQWHVDHKARMVPFGGWDMPVQYAGIAAEHRAVRTGAGLFDISHMARVSFGGTDSFALLEKVFTNSVATMTDGQVRYGLVCNEDGGILDDILVYRWPYGFAAVINAGNREKIVAWLEKHRAGLNVQIQDQTLDTTMVAVQGPKAVELVAGVFAADVTQLKYYYAQPTRFRDKGCVVSRTGYTGEDGFEIMVPNALGSAIWDEFVAKGAMPCGLGARDTLRLEAAMPLYGHELTEVINPIQAGLAWAVKLDKGEFIGRAALQAAASDLTKPVRVGLEVEGKRAAREGSGLTATDGTAAGTVTSGSFCPWLDKSLAMAYVRPELASIGTRLDADARGSTLSATIVPMPFYKRTKS